MPINRRHLTGLAAAALIGIMPSTSMAQTTPPDQAKPLVVFAAASLKNALDAVASAWVQRSGQPAPRISYAGSNTLAKQIAAGASVDLFLSADRAWMDDLATKRLIRPETRTNLLANRIALVAPRETTTAIELKPGLDLAKALGSGRLAIAHVQSVPAGRYGKAALEALGAWEGVKDKLAQADNVRAALLFVARGEAPLGIVYTTDAAAEQRVRLITTFPESTHPAILYPVAITAGSQNPTSSAFLAFLRGKEAAALFARHGFSMPDKPAQGS